MRQTPFIVLILVFVFSFSTRASDLKIDGIEWIRENDYHHYKIKFTISWNNSWNNARNHDAAWVFVKYASPAYRQAGYRHARLLPNGHQLLYNHVSKSPSPTFEVAPDQTGIFIFASANYRGNVRWTIELSLDTAILSDRNFNANDLLIQIFGIEMVKVP